MNSTKKSREDGCDWGYGPCRAPEGRCPHWQGTFCELDVEVKENKTNGKEIYHS